MKIKNNISFLNKIVWYDINEDGYITKPLKNQAVIYIYMNINNLDCYVGSTTNLAARVSSHKSCILNWNKYEKKIKGSTILYESILNYGWSNFKFGVLEYIDLSNNLNIEQKKEIILGKEQYYLDNINPSLNKYKIATNSSLGTKRGIMFSLNQSKAQRGKSINYSFRSNNIVKIVSPETRSKLSLVNQGINVKVFDKFNNLILEFSSIRNAAKHFGVHPKTIGNIYKTGRSFDEYIYKFKVNDIRVWIYNIDNQLLNVIDNIAKTSLFYNIPSSTLSDYIKSGKLYKNKFYFYKTK
jgi:group I intron endonuclease